MLEVTHATTTAKIGETQWNENHLIKGQLQVVGHRGILPGFVLRGGGPSNYTLGESYFDVKIGTQRCADIRLMYSGYYVITAQNGEVDNPADIQVRGAIEQVTPYRVNKVHTLNGFNITVPAGIAHVITDPIGIVCDANELITIHTSIEVSSGDQFPVSLGLGGDDTDKYFSTLTGSSSQVGTYSVDWVGTSRDNADYMFGPTAILGIPENPFPSVLVIGDSIADGAGDTAELNRGDEGGYGWVVQGLWNVGDDNHVVPWIKATKPGDAANNYQGGVKDRTMQLMQYVSHVICQLGTNDIAAGFDLATCQAKLSFVWDAVKVRNKHLTQCLIMPKTSSTDNWETLANQSYATGCEPGGVRDQLNDWIVEQAAAGVIDAYIDPNPYVEDQSDHGKWIVTGASNYPTADGTHPSTAIHDLAALAVKEWAEALPETL